jgi:ABC-type transport system involved in multi-copper enzyme maturation permease subunit
MRLWLRQVSVVARYETPKNMLRARALPLYLLAALPLLVVALMVVISRLFDEMPELHSLAGTDLVYAHVYQFILRIVLYAGCVWIFMNLFRGEVLDRSLHYYFLAPLRREVLVAGKFAAGLLAAGVLFVGSTVASLFLLHMHHGGQGVRHLLFGAGAGQLVAYAGASALACLGYGAVFLAIGLMMRNPIVPALLIWVVEQANPYLPALLKKASVIFYINSLLPVAIDAGPFALVADPVPAWLAVPGLGLFAASMLALAAWRIRAIEISYGVD